MFKRIFSVLATSLVLGLGSTANAAVMNVPVDTDSGWQSFSHTFDPSGWTGTIRIGIKDYGNATLNSTVKIADIATNLSTTFDYVLSGAYVNSSNVDPLDGYPAHMGASDDPIKAAPVTLTAGGGSVCPDGSVDFTCSLFSIGVTAIDTFSFAWFLDAKELGEKVMISFQKDSSNVSDTIALVTAGSGPSGVPAPSTLALLGLGLLAVRLTAKRTKVST